MAMLRLCHCSPKRIAAAVRGDIIGALVFVAAMAACSAVPTAGFWYTDNAFTAPDTRNRLAWPLTSDEVEQVKQVSRTEVERAFAGLKISVTTNPRAFWRVAVVPSLAKIRNERRQRLPAAGESVAMGFLGGSGAIDFDMVMTEAVHFAPLNASRQQIILALGRGIGRVAVHEFMHQMLGPLAAHNNNDLDSYEYGRPDRPSQYYGDLHWTTALPLLRRKFGQ